MSESPIRVLLVDDNESYRKAFMRNLQFQRFDVREASNADDAIARIHEDQPDVMVTDLQMRTRTEGLDLIRDAREVAPLMPIIMISGVGTFEEGAVASQLGAMHVIAKSRIDEEIVRLYALIRASDAERRRNQRLLDELANIRGEGAERSPNAKERIRDILGLPDAPPLVKAEAFEALLALTSEELLAQSRQSLGQAGVGESALREVDESLEQDLADYSQLDPQSRDSLRTAEFLFRQERQIGGDIDFSRNIGFSFCFAVENESKRCLARKLHRMLSNPQFYTIIDQLLEGPTRHLGVFFHQSLLQLQRDAPMSFSIDNVRQVFHRILEHRERYKPDGLKAIAILILCFGRTYDVRTARSRISIENPLALRGLNDDSDIILLAQRLSRLQHYRNPYIHPEISEMEAITAIRQEALACLNVIRRIG